MICDPNKMKQLVFIICLFSTCLYGQTSRLLQIDSIPSSGLLLKTHWKYYVGDDLEFAKPNFNDSTWLDIDPTKELASLTEIMDSRIKWLRINFQVDSKLDFPLGLAVTHAGASEIYLNGKLIHEFGNFDTDISKVTAYDPLYRLIYLPKDSTGQYHLAVRYVLQPNIRYTTIFGLTKNCFFHGTLYNLTTASKDQIKFYIYHKGLDFFVFGVLFMLFILHLAIYLYQRSNDLYLMLTLYLMGNTAIRILKFFGQSINSVETRFYVLNTANWLLSFTVIFLASFYYRVSNKRFDIYYYALVVYFFIYGFISSLTYGLNIQNVLLLLGSIFSFIVLIRLVIMGLKKKIKGFITLAISIFFALLGLICITISMRFLNYGITPTGYNIIKHGISPYLIETIFYFGSIAIPLGLSLFMGIQSKETTIALSKQLEENEELKNKAIHQEQEKQHLLSNQNVLLEKQVEERTAALNNSIETLKSTQNQLIQSEKLASLGELTAGISHEIQNPLNFVKNFSELSIDLVKDIKVELEKPQIDKEYIGEMFTDLILNQERIQQHGNRASSIVKGMLEHSRTSKGKREWIDINQLADEYLRLSYHGLRARDKSFNADYKTELSDSLTKIQVIPEDFGRVILNLVNNAFYAVNDRKKRDTSGSYKPKVTVTTQLNNKQIIIKVIDNGTGIPKEIREKIFQPFFTTKPSGEGTGLGLSLSHEIVTKGHSGTLEVQSEEGEGTTFIITLPIQNETQ